MSMGFSKDDGGRGRLDDPSINSGQACGGEWGGFVFDQKPLG